MSGRSVMDAMLLIKSIEPGACLKASEWTCQWYVDARIEDGDGVILRSLGEHRDTPEAAVFAFLDELISIPADHYLVTRYAGHRREWRWNGAAFSEQTRKAAT